jgi:hypothetical protein
LPGDTLTALKVTTIPTKIPVGGRRVVQLLIAEHPEFAGTCDGKLWRVVVTTTGTEFGMYGARIRRRLVGTFLSGAAGDKFSPLDLAPGVQ